MFSCCLKKSTNSNWCFSLSLLVISLLFFAPSASAQLPQLDKIVLQLKWFHQFQFAGYYAAKLKGYYQDEGLDVEIRERNPEQPVIDQVVRGEADYGIGDSSTVVNYVNGEPVVAVAAILQHDPLVLISKKSSGIISPYEMSGKRIMFDHSGGNEAPIIALLAQAELTTEDYTYIPSTFRNVDLVQGIVDVMPAYLSDQLFYFREKGIDINIISPLSYGLDFYGDILFTSKYEVKNNPQRVDKFRRASLKGWQYALDNPDEVIDFIINQFNPQKSRAHLVFEAESIRSLILPDTIPLGSIEINRLRRVVGIYQSLKLAEPVSDERLSGFIYQQALDFTPEEKEWLDKHPVIRVGIDTSFAPFEWLDNDGNYRGMTADYLNIIESKLGIEFEVVKKINGDDLIDSQNLQKLDIIANAHMTQKNHRNFDFTEPYFKSPVVIISDTSKGYFGSINNLSGKNVAIEKGSMLEEKISRDYPDINLIPVLNEVEALRSVNEGVADACIGDGVASNYYIQQQGLLNLRFSGVTEYNTNHRIAVAHKYHELLSILQKVLNGINQSEKDTILHRWMGLTINQGFKVVTVVKYVLFALVLFILFAFYLIKLRQSEHARALSELQLKTIINNINVYVYLKDIRGEYIYANQMTCDLWNTTLEKVIGSNDRQFFDEQSAKSIQKVDRLVLTKGQTISQEDVRKVKQSGAETVFITTKIPLHNHKGEIYALLGVSTDITERKLAESKIIQSEQLLRSSIEALGEAFAIFDPEDRLVFFNEKYTQMYKPSTDLIKQGRTFEEILRYGCNNGLYVDANGCEDEWIKQLLAIHNQPQSDVMQELNNGRWINLRESKTPSGYTVGYRLDITDLYNAKQKADIANQSKSRFLATMSHEIRTPMNGVLGMAQLLEDTPLNDEQKEYVDLINISGQNLLHIINNILDFSKLDSSMTILEEIDFNLQHLCNECIGMTDSLAQQKNLELILEYSTDCPVLFTGDSVKIKQVLVNLIGNAIKFTHRGFVKIIIKKPQQKSDATLIQLPGSDSGIGIEEQSVGNLFDEFTQADQATTRKYEGTGLGLAITRKLVSLMGGEISVSSIKGEGTQFKVLLSLVEIDVLEQSEDLNIKKSKDEPTFEALNLNILIVEDVIPNQIIAKKFVESFNCKVKLASNGQQAVDYWKNERFDFIFMDCRMPVMDGYDATRKIREIEAGQNNIEPVPIIALTANASEEDRQSCQQAGMNDVVTKPFKKEMLYQSLKKWTSKS